MNDTRLALAEHLRSLGFAVGADAVRVGDTLRRYVGEERYLDFLNRLDAPMHERAARVATFARDIVEANLIRSIDLDVTLEASHEVYRAALPHMTAGATLIELGCWTGGLSSFIAARHDEVSVIGVDYASHILQIARDRFSARNLSFADWDYREAKPERLALADLLICNLGIHNPFLPPEHSPNPNRPRETEAYRVLVYDWSTYFRRWREAAKEGAKLIVTHRLLSLPQLLAFLDAAHRAGWCAQADGFRRVVVPASNLVLPCVRFVASASAPGPELNEDDVAARWVWLFQHKATYLRAEGPMALVLYRQLVDRRSLGSRVLHKPNGDVIHEEAGVVGALSYHVQCDGDFNVRLSFGPQPAAMELVERWRHTPQQQAGGMANSLQLASMVAGAANVECSLGAPPHGEK